MMEGTITRITKETREIWGFRISIPGPFSHLPGQYVMLAFPDDPTTKRAFSIVSADSQGIDILVRKNGELTTRLFGCDEGARILVFGPYGRFTLPKEDKELVFIAGGIGITPLYSMLMHVKGNGYKDRVHLYYSARRKDDMVLKDDLERVEDRRITVKLFFTQEGLKDRVTLEKIKRDVPGWRESMFYICGPGRMIDEFRQKLGTEGIPEEMIRSEEF